MKAKTEDRATTNGKLVTLCMRRAITPREAAVFSENLAGRTLPDVSNDELKQITAHVNAELLKLGANGRNGSAARGGTR